MLIKKQCCLFVSLLCLLFTILTGLFSNLFFFTENLVNLILKCPPNAYKYTKVVSGLVSVSWEYPVASGGSVTSNPYYLFPSGIFGLGTYSITYTATDGSSRFDVCNFRIFVICTYHCISLTLFMTDKYSYNMLVKFSMLNLSMIEN